MAGPNDQTVDVKFGAKLDELTKAFAELSGKFDDIGKKLQESLGLTNVAVDKLTGSVKRLVASWLSFEGVKSTVEITKQLGIEAQKVSSIFGISQAEASQFAVAVGDVYGSMEQAQSAAGFLARQLRANEEELNRIGVATRSANGELVTQKQLFLNAVDAVNQYKTGTDRNAASMVAFGRGALEMQDILRLTPQVLEEARKKADALGLTMTVQGAAAVAEYRAAFNDLEDVMTGFRKMIGDALLPILSELMNWFSSGGKDSINGFKVSVNLVASAVNGFVLTIQIAFAVLKSFADIIATSVIGNLDALWMALTGDVEGAKSALARMAEQNRDTWDATLDDIVKKAQRARERLNALWNPDNTPAGGGGGGGRGFVATNKGLMQELEAELAMRKSAFETSSQMQGRYQQFSLVMERDYWIKVLETVSLSSAQKTDVMKKAFQLQLAITRQYFAEDMAQLQASEQAWKNDLQQKFNISEEMHAKIAKAFGVGSVQEVQARSRMNDAARAILENDKRMAADRSAAQEKIRAAELEGEEALIDHMQAVRSISMQQQFAMQEDLERRRYESARQALDERLELERRGEDQNEAAIAQLMSEREILEANHQKKILDIRLKAEQDSVKFAVAAQDQIQASLSSTIEGLGTKFKSLKDAAMNLVEGIGNSVRKMVSDQIALLVAGPGTGIGDFIKQALGGLSGIFGGSTGGAAGAAASTAPAAAMTTAATTLTAAGTTMTTVLGGPFLIAVQMFDIAVSELMLAASELMAAAATMGMGSAGEGLGSLAGLFGDLMAAPQGYDVPAFRSPITKLHPKEMVLPADLAEGVREMISGGGGGGGGGNQFVFNGVRDMESFRQSKGEILATLGAATSQAVRRNR